MAASPPSLSAAKKGERVPWRLENGIPPLRRVMGWVGGARAGTQPDDHWVVGVEPWELG